MNSDLRRRATHHGRAERSPREDSRPPGGHRNGGSRIEEFSSEFLAARECIDEERVQTGSREQLVYKRRRVVIKCSRSEYSSTYDSDS